MKTSPFRAEMSSVEIISNNKDKHRIILGLGSSLYYMLLSLTQFPFSASTGILDLTRELLFFLITGALSQLWVFYHILLTNAFSSFSFSSLVQCIEASLFLPGVIAKRVRVGS